MQRGQTRYFRMAALNVPDISYKVAEKTGNSATVTFDEDGDLLEKPQARVDAATPGLAFLQVTLAAGGAETMMR